MCLSLIALVVSLYWNGRVERRSEKQRVQSLREADLLRLEEYWARVQRHLGDLNSRRADLLRAEKDEQGHVRDWFEYADGCLPPPSETWPLIPGNETHLAVAVFNAWQHLWASVATLEDRLRRRAEKQLVIDAEDLAEEAIRQANEAMVALQAIIIEGREALRQS